MKRSSLTKSQAQKLGEVIRARREKLGISIRAVEAESGVNNGTISRFERGELLSPQPDTLRNLASTLGLPATDLFTIAGWLPPNELPTLKPYLRAKYRMLDNRAIAELEAYAEQLAKRHGALWPIDREDEES